MSSWPLDGSLHSWEQIINEHESLESDSDEQLSQKRRELQVCICTIRRLHLRCCNFRKTVGSRHALPRPTPRGAAVEHGRQG